MVAASRTDSRTQNVTTVEVRQRPWEVQSVSRSTWDFDVDVEKNRKGDRFKRAQGRRRETAEEMRLLARPAAHAPGHTAYLTYARKRLGFPAEDTTSPAQAPLADTNN